MPDEPKERTQIEKEKFKDFVHESVLDDAVDAETDEEAKE